MPDFFHWFENIFVVTLAITFLLLLLLVYHFKTRMQDLEHKVDTMYDIIRALIQEWRETKPTIVASSSSLPSSPPQPPLQTDVGTQTRMSEEQEDPSPSLPLQSRQELQFAGDEQEYMSFPFGMNYGQMSSFLQQQPPSGRAATNTVFMFSSGKEYFDQDVQDEDIVMDLEDGEDNDDDELMPPLVPIELDEPILLDDTNCDLDICVVEQDEHPVDSNENVMISAPVEKGEENKNLNETVIPVQTPEEPIITDEQPKEYDDDECSVPTTATNQMENKPFRKWNTEMLRHYVTATYGIKDVKLKKSELLALIESKQQS